MISKCVFVEMLFLMFYAFYHVKLLTMFLSFRELRMQRLYLTFLRKTSFLVQMVEKIIEFEYFRIKIQKNLSNISKMVLGRY